MMKKYYLIKNSVVICIVLCVVINIYFISYLKPYPYFIDWRIYVGAVNRFFNPERTDVILHGFHYLPSFFLLSPIIGFDTYENTLIYITIYIIFLLIVYIATIIILFKKRDYICVYITIGSALIILSNNGNIDPFLSLIAIISYYLIKDEREETLSALLLAFITFKVNMLFVMPFYIYITKKRVKFVVKYCIFLLVLNFYLIIHPQYIFDLLQSGLTKQTFIPIFNFAFHLLFDEYMVYVVYFAVKTHYKL